jgi:hypothetical protein
MMVRKRAYSLAGVIILSAGMFITGTALGNGASPSSVQSERQQVVAVEHLLVNDRRDNGLEREQFNRKINSTLETLRANKALQEDQAKQLQTLLQGMNDAASVQTDFINSFVEQMQSILVKNLR